MKLRPDSPLAGTLGATATESPHHNLEETERRDNLLAQAKAAHTASETAHALVPRSKKFSASTLRNSGGPPFLSNPSSAYLPCDQGRFNLLFVVLEALQKLGLTQTAPDALKHLLPLGNSTPGSAVSKLHVKVITNQALAIQAAKVIRNASPHSLAKGAHSTEDQLRRLQMLLLSTPETRAQLLAAVKEDLGQQSEKIKTALSTRSSAKGHQREAEVFIPLVTIGGGPQGQTIANHLHELGAGGANLVVDASAAGDGNFGSVRGHLLNSETRKGYTGSSLEAMSVPDRSQNPVHGSPIQVEDLNPTSAYPTAADIGDAATLGLHAASQRGTPVLVKTRVIGIEEVSNRAGRYLVTLQDASSQQFKVTTNQIVDATGLGTPSVPLRHEASQRYIDECTKALKARGGEALPHQRVMHSEDMLRAANSASNDQILDIVRKSEGNLTVVGWGDSAKTPLLRIKKAADEEGLTMKQLLGDRKIEWIGPKNTEDVRQGLWGPYQALQPYFDEGLVVLVTGRLQQLEAIEGSTQSRLTLSLPDGGRTEYEAGKVILAMGMKSTSGRFLSSIAPVLEPAMRVPVEGRDEVFGDGPLGARLHVADKAHDIFFAGLSSGLSRPEGTSYLEYFGWKTRQLVSQHLMPSMIEPHTQPFDTDLSIKIET
jgi:hypothetical protein